MFDLNLYQKEEEKKEEEKENATFSRVKFYLVQNFDILVWNLKFWVFQLFCLTAWQKYFQFNLSLNSIRFVSIQIWIWIKNWNFLAKYQIETKRIDILFWFHLNLLVFHFSPSKTLDALIDFEAFEAFWVSVVWSGSLLLNLVFFCLKFKF